MDDGESELSPAARPIRCRKCFYVLTGLTDNRCPECGTAFDPNDPSSITRKMPFVWWKDWLPPLLLSVGGGYLLFVLLVPTFGYNAATTMIIPFAIASVVGYACRGVGYLVAVVGVLAALFSLALVFAVQINSSAAVGGVCVAMLAAIFIIPALLGAIVGIILRRMLARTRFSQRDYLNGTIIGLLLLLPVFSALIEGRHDHMPAVTIVTTTQINASPWTVWRNIQFYEQVRTPPPFPLWLSPEVRPKFTTGNSSHPGDVRVCVYEHGQLKKLTREVAAPNRLIFDVVQQHDVENRSIILLDGAFELSPLDGGSRTLLSLRTRYIPLLYPRWAYEWSERFFTHTLHRYIMDDMKSKSEHTTFAMNAR